MLESLQPETVVWDSHFISMEAQNEGWLLHFKNGSSPYADIVIAADGANSKIRPYITHIKAFYSGVTMLEGNIYEAEKAAPHMNHFLNGGKIMAFGNSKDLFIGQKGNGDIGFVQVSKQMKIGQQTTAWIIPIKNRSWTGLKQNIPDGAVFGTSCLKMQQHLLFHVPSIVCL